METRLSPDQLLDQQHYCVLSTCDLSGLPWATPLFYTYDESWRLYWISSKESYHSRVLAKNPFATAVIYSPPGIASEVAALYLTGYVAECTEHELEEALALYFHRAGAGISGNPADYLHTNPGRVYRLESSQAFVLGESSWDGNLLLDKRTEVPIPGYDSRAGLE